MSVKTKLKIALIVLVLILVIPIPAPTRDGGSVYYSPIIRWYQIIDYHQLLRLDVPSMAHDDPNYVEPSYRYIKVGKEIQLFGKTIYDSTYEMEESLN